MATVVTPVPGNRCVGNDKLGEEVRQLKCVKSLDDSGDKVYTCAKWRKFRVGCPKLNKQCSALSEAWVAASVVCRQKLY